jgi:hypothetical protein
VECTHSRRQSLFRNESASTFLICGKSRRMRFKREFPLARLALGIEKSIKSSFDAAPTLCVHPLQPYIELELTEKRLLLLKFALAGVITPYRGDIRSRGMRVAAKSRQKWRKIWEKCIWKLRAFYCAALMLLAYTQTNTRLPVYFALLWKRTLRWYIVVVANWCLG